MSHISQHADHPRLASRIAAALAATTLLGALLAGVPWGLIRFVGWPLPHRLPTLDEIIVMLSQPPTSRMMINLLACICWAAWTAFALDVLAAVAETVHEITSRARTRRTPVPRPRPQWRPGATLVGVVLVALLAGSRPTPAAATPATPMPITISAPAHDTELLDPAPAHQRDRHVSDHGDGHADERRWVTVRPPQNGVHDSLSRIAKRELGDGKYWPQIFELNTGRPQSDGRTLDDPDEIQPGWRIALPEQPNSASPTGENGPSRNPHRPHGPEGAAPRTALPTPEEQPAAPRSPQQQTPPQPPGLSREPNTAQPGPSEFGMDLLAGTWVTGATITGIAAAIMLARRRRQHRHRPEPSLRPVPTPPPTPPTLRAVWAAAHSPTGDTSKAAGDEPATTPDGTTRPRWARTDTPTTDSPRLPVVEPVASGRQTTRQPAWPPPTPALTGRDNDGDLRALPLTDLAGLGVEGPGSPGAVRALVTEMLAQTSLHPPVVHVTADAAHQLFGHRTARLVTPGVLMCHDSIDHATRALEVELLRRMRMLDEHTRTAPDPDQPPETELDRLRAADPGQPLPTIALITTTPGPEIYSQLTGLLGLGRRVGIAGLILGAWPTRLAVDAAHHVHAATGAAARLHGTTLAALTPDDALQLLAEAVAARGGPDNRAASITETTLGENAHDDAVIEAVDSGAVTDPAPISDSTAQRPPGAPAPAVYVRVFGTLRIDAAGAEIRTGLERRARQTLAYLATHDHPVLADTLDEEIFADAGDPRALRHTIISRTRTRLANAAATTSPLIELVNDHYRLNPEAIDADVWQLNRLLDAARAAATDDERREHLRDIPALIAGPPLDGCSYDWAEPVVQRLSTQAVNALLLLADLTEQNDPATALAALTTATTINPFSEELYYKAIHIYVTNGNQHAALQLYRQLEQQLATIDTEPERDILEFVPRVVGSRK